MILRQWRDHEQRVDRLRLQGLPHVLSRNVAKHHIGMVEVLFPGQDINDGMIDLAGDHTDRVSAQLGDIGNRRTRRCDERQHPARGHHHGPAVSEIAGIGKHEGKIGRAGGKGSCGTTSVPATSILSRIGELVVARRPAMRDAICLAAPSDDPTASVNTTSLR